MLVVHVTTAASVKPKDYTVKLKTPGPCASVPPAPTSELRVKEAQDYLQANADPTDLGQITDLDHARHILIEPSVNTINMAVTQDAKDSKSADFTVNMKEPLSCKDAPEAGFEFMLQPNDELDAHLRHLHRDSRQQRQCRQGPDRVEGWVRPAEKKAAAPVHRRPAAGHHRGA